MRRSKFVKPVEVVTGYVVSYDDGRERQEMNFLPGERDTAHHVAKLKAGRHYRASVLTYSNHGCGLDGQYMREAGGIVRQTGGNYGTQAIPFGWASVG